MSRGYSGIMQRRNPRPRAYDSIDAIMWPKTRSSGERGCGKLCEEFGPRQVVGAVGVATAAVEQRQHAHDHAVAPERDDEHCVGDVAGARRNLGCESRIGSALRDDLGLARAGGGRRDPLPNSQLDANNLARPGAPGGDICQLSVRRFGEGDGRRGGLEHPGSGLDGRLKQRAPEPGTCEAHRERSALLGVAEGADRGRQGGG